MRQSQAGTRAASAAPSCLRWSSQSLPIHECHSTSTASPTWPPLSRRPGRLIPPKRGIKQATTQMGREAVAAGRRVRDALSCANLQSGRTRPEQGRNEPENRWEHVRTVHGGGTRPRPPCGMRMAPRANHRPSSISPRCRAIGRTWGTEPSPSTRTIRPALGCSAARALDHLGDSRPQGATFVGLANAMYGRCGQGSGMLCNVDESGHDGPAGIGSRLRIAHLGGPRFRFVC